MKLLIFALCLAFLSIFPTAGASAHWRCGRVWVPGHYTYHHRWVPGHYRHRRWIPPHRGRHGRFIPGHCA